MIIFLINAVFFKLKLSSLIFVGARGVSKQIKFSTGEPIALRPPRQYGHLFLSAGQNGHTFSCQKSPSTVLQFVVLKNAVDTL